MERDDRAVATFHVAAAPVEGRVSLLDEAAAHHVRVRRLAAGERVRLTDGAGTLAAGGLGLVRKASAEVLVDRAWRVARLPELHLFVPVSDRERMLWLAEKATELGVSSWTAVRFHRSASVSPRGEGSAFAAKVRARMVAALEQSAGAWLPEIRGDVSVDDIVGGDGGLRLLLDRDGDPILSLSFVTGAPVSVVFGPEGGLEASERARLVAAAWRPASLGPTTLRFETAGVAACAVVRAMTSKG